MDYLIATKKYCPPPGTMGYESALDATRSISGGIPLVPEAFTYLVGDNAPEQIKFRQTGEKGIVLYEDRNPFGIIKIGGKPKDINETLHMDTRFG